MDRSDGMITADDLAVVAQRSAAYRTALRPVDGGRHRRSDADDGDAAG